MRPPTSEPTIPSTGGPQRALGMLKRSEAEALLIARLDRLTRSVLDLGSLVERYFAQGKAALFSVGKQIDTRSAAGRLVLNVLASVSQWERQAIGERTSSVSAFSRSITAFSAASTFCFFSSCFMSR